MGQPALLRFKVDACIDFVFREEQDAGIWKLQESFGEIRVCLGH